MNTRILSSLLGIAAISLLGLSSLNAGVILSGTAPTTDILLASSGIAATGNFAVSGNTSTSIQQGGIAFDLSSAVTLKKITFYLSARGGNAPGADLRISVVEFSSLPPTGNASYSYTSKYSEVMTLPDPMDVGQYVTFELATPASLSAGTYGVLLDFTTESGGRTMSFRNASDNLSDVVALRTTTYSSNGTTEYLVQAQETYFALQGIPEPSVVFLAGSGLLLAGVLRRRR